MYTGWNNLKECSWTTDADQGAGRLTGLRK